MIAPDVSAATLSIDVIIPVYNMSEHLRPCLASLVSQLGPADSIMVANDGSSEDLGWVVTEFGVQVVANREDKGPYGARNTAAARSTAGVLLFVDARCRALPGLLDAHRDMFADDGVALSCTDVGVQPGDSLAGRVAAVHDWFNAAKKMGQEGNLDFYPTANLGVRRSAFVAVGGFRSLRSGSDADLCWRVQLAALGRFAVDPRMLMTWVPRQSVRALAEQQYRYGQSWAYLEQLNRSGEGSDSAFAAVDLPKAARPETSARPSPGVPAVALAKVSNAILLLGYHRFRLGYRWKRGGQPASSSPRSDQVCQDDGIGGLGRQSWRNLRADYVRYRQDDWLQKPGWWISERTFWAIVMFRVGQRVLEIENPLLRQAVYLPYAVVQALVHSLTGVEIWPNTTIGPGLRIYHGGNVVVNSGTVVGKRCLLRQGVTLGLARTGSQECPVIGDDVEFGAYAQVYGKVHVGDGAKIGAMSLVLTDIPAGATAVGVPARVLPDKQGMS